MATTSMPTTTESSAPGASAVEDLIKQLQGEDEGIRSQAWQHAFIAGPEAVKSLASLMTGTELEVGRAAKRGLWKIVRHAGRPGADDERGHTIHELLELLGDDQPRQVRAEVIWMLSEIGGDESVNHVAALLPNQELREDARMVLQRIPGAKSLTVLEAALNTVPEDFKPNIAQSLRRRSVQVPGLPCRKLIPTKKTNVQPVGR